MTRPHKPRPPTGGRVQDCATSPWQVIDSKAVLGLAAGGEGTVPVALADKPRPLAMRESIGFGAGGDCRGVDHWHRLATAATAAARLHDWHIGAAGAARFAGAARIATRPPTEHPQHSAIANAAALAAGGAACHECYSHQDEKPLHGRYLREKSNRSRREPQVNQLYNTPADVQIQRGEILQQAPIFSLSPIHPSNSVHPHCSHFLLGRIQRVSSVMGSPVCKSTGWLTAVAGKNCR